MFIRFDISAKKRIPFGRKANFEAEVDVLNVMNRPNFNMPFNPGEGERLPGDQCLIPTSMGQN